MGLQKIDDRSADRYMRTLRDIIILENTDGTPLSEFQEAKFNEFLLQIEAKGLTQEILNVGFAESMNIWDDGKSYGFNFYDNNLHNRLMALWIHVNSAMQSPNSQ